MAAAVAEARQEVLNELQKYGIQDEQVYLIDFVPLIEMIWADDMIREEGTELLNELVGKYVDRINRLSGDTLINLKTAKAFVSKFLRQRPDPELLISLRSLISPSRFLSLDPAIGDAVQDSLLSANMDFSASGEDEILYALEESEDIIEKPGFFEILNRLELQK